MSLVSRIIENHTYLTLGLLTTFYCLPSKPLPVHFQRDAICRLEAVRQRERFRQFVFVEIAGGHKLAVVERLIVAVGGGEGGLGYGGLPEPLPREGCDAE